MRSKVTLALLLLLGVAGQCQNLASPYSNSVFPAQIFSTVKTGTPIQLNGLIVPSTVGSSFASGSITLTGTSLTTVTFSVQGSSDNGVTYYPLAISAVATPGTTSTSVTATANGLYQVNLAGLTHLRFVTSGTFTASSVSLVLTASPNAMVSRSGGGGGGAVNSVNGHTGTVVLAATDVGADAAGAASSAQTAAIASAASTSLQKSGGTMTGAIVLPGDPTTALQASTKQYVDAHAGGGTSNPNTCTVNTTMDKCMGISPYLAVAGDWSVASNQAISDLATTGGTVHFCGLYPMNGSPLDPSGANALLKVPTISSGALITIRLSGCQPTTPDSSGLSGFTLQTSVDTPGVNFIGGQSSGPAFTKVKLLIEHGNIISTHAVPQINLVNANWIAAFGLNDIVIGGTGCTNPVSGTGGTGFITPSLSNNFQITIDKVTVACMAHAAYIQEHTSIGNLWMGNNHDCVTFDGGGTGANSISASYIWAQSCINYVIGSGHTSGVNVAVFDMETDPGTGTDILDPSNLISGIIFYKKQSPSGTATISGGTNLLACNLNAISGCFGSVVTNPFLENWKSQDGSGTTLANTGSDSTNTMTATNVTWSTTATGFAGVPVAVYNGTSSVSLAASATQTAFDGTAPFSACAWFNLSTLTFPTGTLANIMSNLSSATGNPGWRMAIFGTGATPVGAMDIYLANNVSTNAVHVTTNTAVFSAGALQLGCFTYDGSKTAAGVIPYVNGTVATTTVVMNTLTGSMVSTSPLRISGEVTNANWFPGALGRARVYSRVLSAAEITAMFSAGPNAI